MKKQTLRILVLASVLALVCSTISFSADKGFSEEQIANMQAATNAMQSKRVMAVTKTFVGPMDKIGTYLDRFMTEFEDQGLNAALNGYRTEPIIVLEKDPLDGPATMQIGLTVGSYVATSGSLKMQDYRFGGSVSYTYSGDYDQLCPVYYEIAANLEDQGQSAGFPVIMMPIDDPTYGGEVRTEMIIPVGDDVFGIGVLPVN